jgi:uncharacterized membrane protein YqjE
MFGATDRLQDVTWRLLDETRNLIRLEIELAQAEMTAKAKVVARALAYAGVAAVFVFYAVFGLLIAAIWGLATVMPTWAAALVVAGVFLLLAALVGLLAVRRARKVGPPYPDEAIANISHLPDDLREAAGE